ncbi:hypothetical protein IQ06DRAFT_290719 [Phaeosphaeriaceae sp. SRC1lsM3a]|nr:hypothetical protein IQ06DRAFT_290719 [Stagonospora sp. SRC1lsM3a]
MTADVQPDAYALLDSHFTAPPLQRHRSYSPRPAPLRHDTQRTDTDSAFSSQQPTPLDPPAAANGPDAGLPPTPPTMSQDGQSTPSADAAPHDETLLMSKKSSLSTPVNARSPPTPDPSPPRTASTATTSNSNSNSIGAPERPPLFAYPSSRAESFKTAREDASSEPSRSRSVTPIDHRLSTVEEDRGLGLAFELEENEITPTDRPRPFYPPVDEADTMAGAQEDKEPPVEDIIPDREWNTDLMRNVTVRRKRKPNSSPEKDPIPTVEPASTASPSPSPRPRRTSGLRERVEASTNSPVTPSIENFAQSIGWPSEKKPVAAVTEPGESNKRDSTSSMGSTRVEASIIVTPPRRRQTLRHSGKNMAYRDSSPTPDRPLRRRSNRDSSQTQNEDVPLHRLVHKKVNLADRSKRISTDSATLGYERSMSTTLGYERSMSSPLSFRSRIIDSSAATLAHQQSLRNVLQPAADMLSRANSVTKYHYSEHNYHRRIGSAPENGRKSALSNAPRSYSQQSPPTSPRRNGNVSFQTPPAELSPVQSPVPSMSSPRSLKRRQRSSVADSKFAMDVNKSLPVVPAEEDESATQDVFLGASAPLQDRQPPTALLDRVRQLVTERDPPSDEGGGAKRAAPASPEQIAAPSPPEEYSPPVRRGSRSIRGRSGERRRSTPSQDRTSTSPEVIIRPSLDRISTEEMVRRSHEWRRPSLEHGRASFDRSMFRSEEHAGARHQYASTTPFSQFSDTPIEVSEATAVSIYPHNNHSLLVVQQGTRVSSMTPESRQLTNGTHLSPYDHQEVRSTPTPPFVDAIEDYDADHDQSQQPTLTFEPSTPPMQLDLPQANTVDSPLKNPRPPPEPPKIMFIPPTPAEELEKQLVPGPPKRSDSHPQRRLSLAQRARRYSDNLIPTLLSRKGSNRKRNSLGTHKSHHNPQIPTVNDEDGQLHPFWRPRGFWDGFDDDSDSESEDEGLHPGGDTSDVESLPDPPPPKRTNTLRRRLTSSVRGSGGFLIGNSLGVERHGTNKRRHHITLPPNFPRLPRTSSHTASPKILIQPPTMPLGAHGGGGITKRPSRSSLRRSFDAPPRRQSWRQGRSLPGLKKYQVQYIGISGVKDKIRERSQEKRRQKIRQSIGSRIYMEPGSPNSNAA